MENVKMFAKDYLQLLGRDIIKLAVASSDLDASFLYDFHPTEFKAEVAAALMVKYATDLVEATRWFVDRNDKANAEDFVCRRWKQWSDDDIVWVFLSELKLRPNGLISELKRRKLIMEALCRVLLQKESWDIAVAIAGAIAELGPKLVTKKDMDELDKSLGHGRVYRSAPFSTEKIQSSLSVFFDLCRDPYSLSLRFSKAWHQRFGKDRVLKAVCLGGPYQEDGMTMDGV
jgi:hypothetical protein